MEKKNPNTEESKSKKSGNVTEKDVRIKGDGEARLGGSYLPDTGAVSSVPGTGEGGSVGSSPKGGTASAGAGDNPTEGV